MEDLLLPIWRTGVSFIILVLVTFRIGKHINPHKNHFMGFFYGNAAVGIYASLKTQINAFRNIEK